MGSPGFISLGDSHLAVSQVSLTKSKEGKKNNKQRTRQIRGKSPISVSQPRMSEARLGFEGCPTGGVEEACFVAMSPIVFISKSVMYLQIWV